ncbi:choice-of-anchor X domain-containing protein [Litorivivens sp.]|uniref:choice-of-anchor X domain-containing protein n=2 Tax=Litorivivens sp. TaxID=2020868 RepID=UPI00356AF8F9
MNRFSKMAVLSVLPLMSSLASAADAPNLAQQAAQEYLNLAKYPEWTLPVPAGAANPILADREVDVVRQLGPNGSGPALAVWSDSIRYERGDTANLFAQLQAKPQSDADVLSAPSADAKGPWQIRGEIVDASNETVASVTFADDGKGADQAAGDGIYSASYVLGEAGQPAVGQAASLGYRVTAENEAQEQRVAMNGFQYSHPAASLTGEFKDRVVDGNLVISAQVEAVQAGRVHLAGVVNNALGDALVLAQTSATLGKGEQWVDLVVYGLPLREAVALGPLSLGAITLTTTQGMPNALGDVLQGAHQTGVIAPTALTDKPFGRANLLDAAARLNALAK